MKPFLLVPKDEVDFFTKSISKYIQIKPRETKYGRFLLPVALLKNDAVIENVPEIFNLESVNVSEEELSAKEPSSVSKQSLRLALVEFNIYKQDIINAIAAIENNKEREQMTAYWESATDIRVEHYAFEKFRKMLNVSKEQKEAILRLADEIQQE